MATKELIGSVVHARIDEKVVEATANHIADIRATPEGQEGLSAFLEKRKAAWVSPTPAPAKQRAKKR